MIPILFESTETSFATNGIGRLSDAISCIVTEERNGPYELEMQYPITGQYFSELTHSRIIYAVPSDGTSAQPFRIYRISKPLDGICTIYAEHISYELNSIPVLPFEAYSTATALEGLVSNAGQTCPFTVWTDKTVAAPYTLSEPRPFRELLGGSRGSILDVYGKGEYEFDKYLVRLYVNRGTDSGVVIRYAKNLTELVNDENIEDVYTGVCPFWKDSETGDLVLLPEVAIWSETAANFPYKRTKIIDASEEFDDAPTVVELRAWAQNYIDANDIGVPKVNIDVSFVPLWQSSGASLGRPDLNLEIGSASVNNGTLTAAGRVDGDTVYLDDARFTVSYSEYQVLERVNLCDTVTVVYDALGVSTTAKVIKTTYNVLKDRYDSIEVGEARTSLARQILGLEDEIENQTYNVRLDISDELQAYVDHQTNLLSGGLGGYVVLNPNADGEPQEILIMDSPDMNTAVHVIRMNKNGIGFSSTGYEGPFTSAWTIDGVFNADFIGAGQMSGGYIKAHTINASHLTIGDNTNFVTVREQYANSMLPATNALGGTVVSNGSVQKMTASNSLLAMSDILASDWHYGDQIYYQFEAGAPSTKSVRLAIILYDGTQTEVERFYTETLSVGSTMTEFSGSLYMDYAHFDDDGNIIFPMATVSNGVVTLANGSVSNGLLLFSNRESAWRYYSIVLVDGTSTQLYYRNAVIRRKNGGTLIVDGSITTEKLAAGAITAGKIAAGAVTAQKIAAGSITIGKLGSDVTSSLTNAVSTAEEAEATANNAAVLVAGKSSVYYSTSDPSGSGYQAGDVWIKNVASGIGGDVMWTYSGSGWVRHEIGTTTIINGSITTDLLAANAVTTAKILAGNVTADKLAANSVTAEKIASGAITAGNISLYGKMGVYTASDLATNGGYIGYMSGQDSAGTSTNGIALMDSASLNHIIVTTGGVRMTNRTSSVASEINISGGAMQYKSSGTGAAYIQGNVYLNTTDGSAYAGITRCGPSLYVEGASGGNRLVGVYGTSGEYGEIDTFNAAGQILVQIARQNNGGNIIVGNSGGSRRGQMGVSSDGTGGYLYLYDSNVSTKASMYVTGGSGGVNVVASTGLSSTIVGGGVYLYDNSSPAVARAQLIVNGTSGNLLLTDSNGNTSTLTKALIDKISTGQKILGVQFVNLSSGTTVAVGSTVNLSESVTEAANTDYLCVPVRMVNCITSTIPALASNTLTVQLQNVSAITTTLACTIAVIAYG